MTTWPRYPAYDVGPHLEERAIDRFGGRTIGRRKFLSYPWTPAFNAGVRPNGMAASSSSAPLAFAVATHDDAPGFSRPHLRAFAGGGNGGGEPIPLVCESEPPGEFVPFDAREHTVAFSGSDTHPLRCQLLDAVARFDIDGPVRLAKWTPTPDAELVRRTFHDLRRARFALAPRGYGPTSYRLYEAIRCGVVPVYVTDRPWLPFPDIIDWEHLAIIEADACRAARRIVEMPHAEWLDRARYALDVAPLLTPSAVLSRIQSLLEAETI